MKLQYKILITLFILISVVFCFGITYSIFHSNSSLSSGDQSIAKFIFNAESSNQIQLPLIDLNPGDSKQYAFAVSNNTSGSVSNVTAEYQMTIKTYHLVPLAIKLYRLNGETEELIMTCDEAYTRNSSNELVCTTPTEEIGYSAEELDNYVLKVDFPSEYNSVSYSDLVDYINIEIKSWQKLED